MTTSLHCSVMLVAVVFVFVPCASAAPVVQWSGVLQTAASQPIDGATVRIQEDSQVSDAITSNGGHFHLALPAGSATFFVEIRGPSSELRLSPVTLIQGTVELVSDFVEDITLPESAAVAVSVSNSHGGPVAGAQVLNFDTSSTELPVVVGAGLSGVLEAPWIEVPNATDAEGKGTAYSYPGIEYSGLLAREVVEGVSILTETPSFTIAPGTMPIELEFVEDQPVFWTGALRTATHQPVPGIEVVLASANSIGSAVTGGDGGFRVGSLPGDTFFSAEIRSPPAEMQLPPRTELSAERELSANFSQDISLPATAPVEVTVTGNKAKPVVGASVDNATRSETRLAVELAPGFDASLEAPFFEGPTTDKQGHSTSYTFPGIEFMGLLAEDQRKSGRSFSGVSAPFTVSATGAKVAISLAPTVSQISPSSGAVGSEVEISGSNFTDVKAVKFGKAKARRYTVNSSESITATVPAGSGTVHVTVVRLGGTSSTSPADLFQYE